MLIELYTKVARPKGFEPSLFCVTGRYPFQTGPRAREMEEPEGVSPPSLVDQGCLVNKAP